MLKNTLFILFLVSFMVSGVQVEAKGVDANIIPDHYIVVLKDSVEDADVAADDITQKHNGRKSMSYHKALKGFSAIIPQAELEAVKNDPRVLFVSEDREVSIDKAGGPADASNRGGSTQTLPTGVDRINAENKSNKGNGVNVAILDTGIDLNHPDLKANIAGGKNCSTGNSYADGNGHGTHVAGTVAAINNNTGVVGVAPKVKLWSVRVLDNTGYGSWSAIICGIDFVTSKAPAFGGPIKVANMSITGSGSSDNNCGLTNNDALHNAICRSRDAGVTYIVAAGNNGSDTANFVPAAYDAVITVSAIADSDGKTGGLGAATSYGQDDTFASFSNYGSAVDIAAPGVDIYSTFKNRTYGILSGTSMASPHVAGAAALYIATHPGSGIRLTEIKNALRSLGETLLDPSGLHSEPVLRADTL